MARFKNAFFWFLAAIGTFFSGVALISAANGLLSLNISLSFADALEYYRDAIRTCFFWFPLVFHGWPPQWYMDLFAVNLLLANCLVKTVMDHPRGGSVVGSTFRFTTIPAMWDRRIFYLTVPYLVMMPYLIITPALNARIYYLERKENIKELKEKEAFQPTARARGVEYYDRWVSDMEFERRRISGHIEMGTATIKSFLRFYAYLALAVAAAAVVYIIQALAPVAPAS